MGGNNVKGLYWMETIFPMPNGQSVIPPEKLQKEFQKGTLRPPDPNAEKEVDGDMDEKIDKVVQDIWAFYDPKSTGIMPRKVMEKFFKDALDLYALRMGKKSSKEVMPPNIKWGEAMAQSCAKVTSNPQQASKKEFEDFLNCYDLDEALGSFLNIQEVAVNHNVQFVDTSQFKEQAAQPKKVVYRDYSVLKND